MKHSILLHRVAIILLALLLVLTVTFFALRQINRSFFEERSANMQILMGRIAANIDQAIEQEWDHLTFFGKTVENAPPTTLALAQAQLRTLEQNCSDHILALTLLDETGQSHTSDGAVSPWPYADLLSASPTCTVSAKTEDAQLMYFMMPLSAPLTLTDAQGGRVTLTHIAMTISMTQIDALFEMGEFGSQSTALLLRTDGTQLYRAKPLDALSQESDLLTALGSGGAVLHYDATLDTLRADLVARGQGCVSLILQERNYYLVYQPLSVNGWMTAALVERDAVSSGTAGFVWSVVLSLLLVALVTLAAIITIIMTAARSANRRLQRAMAAEQRANAAKTLFLSSMSHDIRTPMNAIFGMTTLAIEHSDDQAYVRDCLDKVRLSSQHLLTLINDVLDISKVESGQMTLSPSDCSLQEELARLISIIQPQADQKHQDLSILTSGLTLDRVRVDKLRLSQIMLNLLSNAVKYTPDGGMIQVELACHKRPDHDLARLTYTVSDTGIGMSPEFQQKMYSSFVRENNAPQRTVQGTGLGLTICKQMVDLMGGTIACESQVGEGTTFTVTLDLAISDTAPRTIAPEAAETPAKAPAKAAAQDPAQAPAEVPAQAPEAPAIDHRPADLAGAKILVAEDNDFNWEIVRELLAMHGIKTDRAENGQIAVDMLRESVDGAYDLVLMDIQMPIMNGYLATARIRASSRPYLKSIPIIAMTADAFSEDIQKCAEVGMNAHLAKPIDLEMLLRVMKEVSGRG